MDLAGRLIGTMNGQPWLLKWRQFEADRRCASVACTSVVLLSTTVACTQRHFLMFPVDRINRGYGQRTIVGGSPKTVS